MFDHFGLYIDNSIKCGIKARSRIEFFARGLNNTQHDMRDRKKKRMKSRYTCTLYYAKPRVQVRVMRSIDFSPVLHVIDS